MFFTSAFATGLSWKPRLTRIWKSNSRSTLTARVLEQRRSSLCEDEVCLRSQLPFLLLCKGACRLARGLTAAYDAQLESDIPIDTLLSDQAAAALRHAMPLCCVPRAIAR
mmetsp:Transcript_21258/g.46916  ORF Transcript_21258/g.46916 Transcript_21258/m.46916 type:complete len:110 (-) Transcript_21258:58-387(-)